MQNITTIQDLYTSKLVCDNLHDMQEIAARSTNIEDQIKSYWDKHNFVINDFFTLCQALSFEPNTDDIPLCSKGLYWHVPKQNSLYITSFKTASSSMNNFFQLAAQLGTTCYQNHEHLQNSFNYKALSYKDVNYADAKKFVLFREPIQRLKSALNMLIRESLKHENQLGGCTTIYPWALLDPQDSHISSQMLIVPIDINRMSLKKLIRFSALCTTNWREYFNDIDVDNFSEAGTLFNVITSCIPLFLKLTFDVNSIGPNTRFFAISKSDDLVDPFHIFSTNFMKYKKNKNPVVVSFKENMSQDKDTTVGKNFHKEAVEYVEMTINKKPYMPGAPVNRSLIEIFTDQLSTEIEFYNLMTSKEYREKSTYKNVQIDFFQNLIKEK